MWGRHVERTARLELSNGVILDTTAHSCKSLIDRPIVVDVKGTVFQAVVTAFNAASGQNVPTLGGMGTCAVGVKRGTANSVQLSGQMSLRKALDAAVGQVSGVVWLAVEGTDGTCGVGLYSGDALRMSRPDASGEDAFCMMQVGKVP
jgi:hypothetical protein